MMRRPLQPSGAQSGCLRCSLVADVGLDAGGGLDAARGPVELVDLGTAAASGEQGGKAEGAKGTEGLDSHVWEVSSALSDELLWLPFFLNSTFFSLISCKH
jgi:hypothetical protein